MPELPERKAGIVACSGEELAEGTVTRLAALKVLQQLRPYDTVTICLPLFLAGGEGDRAFARFHPTITVDGCELRCAARATEMYSGKPAVSIVVSELVAEQGLPKPQGQRILDEAGRRAVDIIAEYLAAVVDKVLGKNGASAPSADGNNKLTVSENVQATCSCGSGIPITRLIIDGKEVEIVALPLIFQRFRESGFIPDETAACKLLETVKVYNAVATEAESSYREAILREYAAYCDKETNR